jgi:hypothetical protein
MFAFILLLLIIITPVFGLSKVMMSTEFSHTQKGLHLIGCVVSIALALVFIILLFNHKI